MDIQQEVFEVIKPVLDFWLLVSLCATLATVQVLKATLKHLVKNKWSSFTISAIVFIGAVIIGYTLTRFFLELPEALEQRMAMAVALLNVAVYKITLVYVRRKGWIRFEALLRMKTVCENEDGSLYISDKTMLFNKGETSGK